MVGGSSSSAAIAGDCLEQSVALLVDGVGVPSDAKAVPVGEVALAERASDDECSPVERLKRRRLLPGAATSHVDFDTHFQKCREEFEAAAAVTPSIEVPNEDTVLGDYEALRKIVVDRMPEWDEELVRVAMAILTTLRLRLRDAARRERAIVLWIIEGYRFVRVHDSVLYWYDDHGTWVLHNGTVPEKTFARVSRFLRRVEGLLTLANPATPRTDDGILDSIDELLKARSSVADLFTDAMTAALFAPHGRGRGQGGRGGARGRGRGRGRDNVEDDGEGDGALVGPGDSWTMQAAFMVMCIGQSLYRDLHEDSLTGLLIRWCSTPMNRASGVAYLDANFIYHNDAPFVRPVLPSPDNNIYLFIAQPLLDPMFADAMERLTTFYKQTFWANLNVFQCCQAALALAERGENIVRCFIGMSPGGVGQSLYSAHLDAMHQNLHSFFDPNVWYQEGELQKQVEQWEGCIVLTGQEAPGTGKRLMEDLFKKTISGDGVAGLLCQTVDFLGPQVKLGIWTFCFRFIVTSVDNRMGVVGVEVKPARANDSLATWFVEHQWFIRLRTTHARRTIQHINGFVQWRREGSG